MPFSYKLWTAVFWWSLFLVIYTYCLYPVLLTLAYAAVQGWRDLKFLLRSRSGRIESPSEWPAVSVVIPVHNEVSRLPAKLQNLRRLDYPPARLEILFASDGSTDGTNELLSAAGEGWPALRLTLVPERRGKANALNHGIAQSRGEILVLCDASTLIPPDAIYKLARHFQDKSVGLVAASTRFAGPAESARTEGLYWKYETALRVMEARLGWMLVASGPLYALRRDCYFPLSVNTLVDDLITALRTRQLGKRVVYDPEVTGQDYAADSVSDEFKRRVRLAMGSFRAFPEILRTMRRPCFTFALFSHKICRWVLPVPLATMLLASAVLPAPFYRAALAAQIAFYMVAAAGWRWPVLRQMRFLLLPYYLVNLHAAFVVGFVRIVRGESRSGIWERVT